MLARIGIVISGNGSNMMAIHHAILSGQIEAELAWVASDNKQAGGLNYASKNLVPCTHLDYHAGKQIGEQSLLGLIAQQPIDLLCLAGFMQILSPPFLQACQNQYRLPIINIHPSLLPALKGLNTHQRALDEGHGEHGCTVHVVTEKLDDGPILAQSSLDLKAKRAEGITPPMLGAEILKLEHVLYPRVIAEFATKFNQGKGDAIPHNVKKYVSSE